MMKGRSNVAAAPLGGLCNHLVAPVTLGLIQGLIRPFQHHFNSRSAHETWALIVGPGITDPLSDDDSGGDLNSRITFTAFLLERVTSFFSLMRSLLFAFKSSFLQLLMFWIRCSFKLGDR